MPVPRLRALAAALLVASASLAAVTVPAGPAVAAPCRTLLGSAARASTALGRLAADDRDRAAGLNGTTTDRLAATARRDPTLWLDRCGRGLYVDPAAPAPATTASSAAPAASSGPLVPFDRTFQLASRPGSRRTLYLDFTGATVTGTAWNTTVRQSSFTVPAYDRDGNAASFGDDELAQVQRAWAIVAEDYAPFDVNVTTRDPGTAAIDRSSAADTTYGDRVVVTAGGPVWEAMGRPGGVSYTGAFGLTSRHAAYQPGWVFTAGLGAATGKEVGEAAAHEAGHAFGLSHDGVGKDAYATGSGLWAPIMGASYYAPVTQWSRGEYAGATNTEDDSAIIAKVAPYVADDHGGTAASATPLTAGTPVAGLIGTRSDTDAFALAAAGTTTVAVVPSALQPDLDVSLTVYDAAGALVARVDPPAVSRGAAVAAAGLDASVTFEAPDAGARYTAVVDGVGTGDPKAAGRYSDYGSLGAYRVELATAGEPVGIVLPSGRPATTVGTTGGSTATPPTAAPSPATSVPARRATRLAAARAGHRYRTSVRLRGAGRALRWHRTGALPRGLRLVVVDRRVLRVSGRPRSAGRYRFQLVGRAAGRVVVRRDFELVVRG